MKDIIIFLIVNILIISSVKSQNTNIPDPNFEQALIDLNYDNVIDGSVLTANIATVTFLNVFNKNISDLTGIEDFIALEDLMCSNNQFTSLDLSSNVNLHSISAYNCNQLSWLDVSNGNNTNFGQLSTSGSNNLECIQVDDTLYSQTNWTINFFAFQLNSYDIFSLNCGATSGIIDEASDLSLSVYPVPATRILNVSFEKGANYSLISVAGKKAMQTGRLQNELTSIDISSLKTGMYLLRVITDEGNIITKRVIKQ